MREVITLRPYRKEDLDALYALDVVCFAEPFRFSRRSMRHFAEARGAHTVIAEAPAGSTSEAGIAGFVIVQLQRDREAHTGYIVTLDVSPAERRTGVGRRLMDEAEALAARAGAQRIDLHVFERNKGAIRFYEARGYDHIGEEQGFYGVEKGSPLNALVYRKEPLGPQ